MQSALRQALPVAGPEILTRRPMRPIKARLPELSFASRRPAGAIMVLRRSTSDSAMRPRAPLAFAYAGNAE